MTMTKTSSRKFCYTSGHGHLKILVHKLPHVEKDVGDGKST